MNSATAALYRVMRNTSDEYIQRIDDWLSEVWRENESMTKVVEALQAEMDVDVEEDPYFEGLSPLLLAFVSIGRNAIDYDALCERWVYDMRIRALHEGSDNPFPGLDLIPEKENDEE